MQGSMLGGKQKYTHKDIHLQHSNMQPVINTILITIDQDQNMDLGHDNRELSTFS